MNAYKCDRCSKYFEGHLGGHIASDFILSKIFLRKPPEIHPIKADLCPDCAKEIAEAVVRVWQNPDEQ